jgi:hypothetical protein
MKKISIFFEYLYYRITKAYYKWDGDEGITAIIAISMLQTLLIGDFIIFIIRLFLDRGETLEYAKIASGIGVGVFLILGFVNFLKYRKKFDEYQLKWGNENKIKKRIRGVLIVVSLIIPWLILVYFGRI